MPYPALALGSRTLASEPCRVIIFRAWRRWCVNGICMLVASGDSSLKTYHFNQRVALRAMLT